MGTYDILVATSDSCCTLACVHFFCLLSKDRLLRYSSPIKRRRCTGLVERNVILRCRTKKKKVITIRSLGFDRVACKNELDRWIEITSNVLKHVYMYKIIYLKQVADSFVSGFFVR